MMKFYLDTADENMVDALALHAHDVPGNWNGLPVPLVTAPEFWRFVSAWHRNDPNGEWYPDDVKVVGGYLLYDDEAFSPAGTNDFGVTLYGISGWDLIQAED